MSYISQSYGDVPCTYSYLFRVYKRYKLLAYKNKLMSNHGPNKPLTLPAKWQTQHHLFFLVDSVLLMQETAHSLSVQVSS